MEKWKPKTIKPPTESVAERSAEQQQILNLRKYLYFKITELYYQRLLTKDEAEDLLDELNDIGQAGKDVGMRSLLDFLEKIDLYAVEESYMTEAEAKQAKDDPVMLNRRAFIPFVEGVPPWETETIRTGKGNKIELIQTIHRPEDKKKRGFGVLVEVRVKYDEKGRVIEIFTDRKKTKRWERKEFEYDDSSLVSSVIENSDGVKQYLEYEPFDHWRVALVGRTSMLPSPEGTIAVQEKWYRNKKGEWQMERSQSGPFGKTRPIIKDLKGKLPPLEFKECRPR